MLISRLLFCRDNIFTWYRCQRALFALVLIALACRALYEWIRDGFPMIFLQRSVSPQVRPSAIAGMLTQPVLCSGVPPRGRSVAALVRHSTRVAWLRFVLADPICCC